MLGLQFFPTKIIQPTRAIVLDVDLIVDELQRSQPLKDSLSTQQLLVPSAGGGWSRRTPPSSAFGNNRICSSHKKFRASFIRVKSFKGYHYLHVYEGLPTAFLQGRSLVETDVLFGM